MNEFDELKDAARRDYRSAVESRNQAASMALSSRHNLDQAEGAMSKIEELLKAAPDEAKPEIATILDSVSSSIEFAEKQLASANSMRDLADRKVKAAYDQFLKSFGEEP